MNSRGAYRHTRLEGLFDHANATGIAGCCARAASGHAAAAPPTVAKNFRRAM